MRASSVSQAVRYAFEDHNAPALPQLMAVCAGSGRIVASETELPIVFVNLAERG